MSEQKHKVLNFKKLVCKYFRHNHQPLILKTGLQLHRCTRCGDERNAFVIMAGESVEFIIELKGGKGR